MTTPEALLDDLRAVGVTVDGLSEMVNAKRQRPEAVPVLLSWLQRLDAVPAADRRMLHEMLVRSIGVPAARGVAGSALVEQFRTVDDPTGLGLRWVIGNALSWSPTRRSSMTSSPSRVIGRSAGPGRC